MNIETPERHSAPAPRSWSRIGDRLAALVSLTARLPSRYPSLTFGRPIVLTAASSPGRHLLHWELAQSFDVWLKWDGLEQVLALRAGSCCSSGQLLFWALISPSDETHTISGFVVTRPRGAEVVAKVRRTGTQFVSSDFLCVVVPLDLAGDADKALLASLPRSFTDAYSAEDKDAWAAWLWRHASQGHLPSAYARTLATKVLGTPRNALVWDRPILINRRGTSLRANTDLVQLLHRLNVFEHEADYVLPSGLHAVTHINLGNACGSTDVVKEIALRVKALVDSVDYDTIVTTGWTTATIAREVVRLRPLTKRGVVRLREFEGIPPVPLAAVGSGRLVVILTDVVVSATLAATIVNAVRAAGSTPVVVIAVVDGGCSKTIVENVPLQALCAYDVHAVVSADCTSRLPRREFNPIACSMTATHAAPRSPSEFLRTHPEAVTLWQMVDQAKAYEHHRVEGDIHYISFIDTARLLTHEVTSPQIIADMWALIHEAVGVPDVLLVPHKSRARTLVELLLASFRTRTRLWLPQVVYASRSDGYYRLAGGTERRALQGATVAILDTGASHGTTIDELGDLAASAGAAVIGAVVVISRMSDGQEAAISERLSGRFRKLFQVPIRPLFIPSEYARLCPVCRERDEIARAAASKVGPLVEYSRAVQARRARRPAELQKQQPSRSRQSDLPLNAPSFLASCRRATASGVTQHSLHSAMNNGMARLKVPELFDETIPRANRKAMIDHLSAVACTWSADTLIPDAQRFLAEHDLDEVWTACASLLNRTSSLHWLDALRDRLSSSDITRQQDSKSLWNKLAFEVFVALGKEPDQREPIRTKIDAMLQMCEKAPARHGVERLAMVACDE